MKKIYERKYKLILTKQQKATMQEYFFAYQLSRNTIKDLKEIEFFRKMGKKEILEKPSLEDQIKNVFSYRSLNYSKILSKSAIAFFSKKYVNHNSSKELVLLKRFFTIEKQKNKTYIKFSNNNFEINTKRHIIKKPNMAHIYQEEQEFYIRFKI